MSKKFFRALTLGVIIFSIACLAGYLSYLAVYNQQSKMLNKQYNTGVYADSAPTAGESMPDGKGIKYVAKFENDDISIYMSNGYEDIFLYSLDIYTKDLPVEDLIRLKEGIVLENKEALTAFEEDFTS